MHQAEYRSHSHMCAFALFIVVESLIWNLWYMTNTIAKKRTWKSENGIRTAEERERERKWFSSSYCINWLSITVNIIAVPLIFFSLFFRIRIRIYSYSHMLARSSIYQHIHMWNSNILSIATIDERLFSNASTIFFLCCFVLFCT